MGAYNKFIQQNVKKCVQAAQASCDLDKSLDQQIKKNFENFIKKNASTDVAKKEKPYSLTRIQSDHLSKNEKANVNISNLSTLPLCSNIKSIRPIYNKPVQSQSSLMLGSSLKALAAPMSLLATKSEISSIPTTPSTLLNCMAKVTAKNKSVAPVNYNEQLLSNLVKREMISKYSTPSTTCTTGGTTFNNLQLLYPQTKFEQIHSNAINPPQTQTSTGMHHHQQRQQHQHGQFQRSREPKPQPYEQHHTQTKYPAKQLHRVPHNQQKYIINATKRSTEPYSTNYARNKIKTDQPQTSTSYKVSTSQDKTLLSEPSAPISELNTSISQTFIYNQILNLKSKLLQSRLLGISSEDN